MGLAPPTAPAGAGVQAGRGIVPAFCVRHISLLFLFPLLCDTCMVFFVVVVVVVFFFYFFLQSSGLHVYSLRFLNSYF